MTNLLLIAIGIGLFGPAFLLVFPAAFAVIFTVTFMYLVLSGIYYKIRQLGMEPVKKVVKP